MTAPEKINTADLGIVPFPAPCPSWCDQATHVQYVLENDGVLDADDATTHRRHGGVVALREIRKPHSKTIERDGGGSWELNAKQGLIDPSRQHSGYASQPLIEVFIREPGLGMNGHMLNVTTAEARQLMFHLQRLVDIVDGGDL